MVWIDDHFIAKLFGVNRHSIVKYIQRLCSAGELEELSTCSILEQVAADGKVRKMNVYNLYVINSVGYRVNSKHVTQIWQWVTLRLKEYLVEGASNKQSRLTQIYSGARWGDEVVYCIVWEHFKGNYKIELYETKLGRRKSIYIIQWIYH